MSEKSKQNPNQKMRIKFITLGCKVNQYETQALKEQFLSSGHKITEGKADLYVVNTCAVTNRADRKSKDAILKSRKENPTAKIAVCGCLVQCNRAVIEKLAVDYVVPQDKKYLLADIILGNSSVGKNIWSLKISRFNNCRAFVKVQDGCNHFCSFCVVPYVRGRSISRGKEDVLAEINRVSKLHKEIVLCGINLGLYGRDLTPRKSLYQLVDDILKIDSLQRLRLSSLAPYFITNRLISLFANSKLCPHLHLPFQNGDDRVLKDMNKKETVSLYEDIVKKAKRIIPSFAVSCDIMVGFPTENNESFANTISFLKRVKPMRTHIFTFSSRPRTKQEGIKIKNMKDIRRRFKILKNLTDDFAYEYNLRFLGKTLYMAAEERNNGYSCGYTENYMKVYVKRALPLGEIYPVRIDRVEKNRVIAALSR